MFSIMNQKSIKAVIGSMLQIIILLGYALFYLYTIITKRTVYYVHPRIIPYLFIASVVFILVAFVKLYYLLKGRLNSQEISSLLIYLFPLMVALIFPAESINSQTGMINELDLTAKVNKSETIARKDLEEYTVIENIDLQKPELQKSEGRIEVTNENYYSYLSEIYENLNDFIGREIEVVGFVYRDNEQFAEDQFVPARLMMVCCAADMAPVGMMCRYDDASALVADTWYKVIGIIRETQFNNEKIPYIEVSQLIPTEAPEEEYIYPY